MSHSEAFSHGLVTIALRGVAWRWWHGKGHGERCVDCSGCVSRDSSQWARKVVHFSVVGIIALGGDTVAVSRRAFDDAHPVHPLMSL